MFVVEVIPMGRGTRLSTLTYFSGASFERGSIVSVPLRNGISRSIVVSCTEASTAKTALRAATFSLRKLPEQKNSGSLSRELMDTADALSDYYAAQAGAVLFQLIPNEIKKGIIDIPTYEAHTLPYGHMIKVLHAPTTNRFVEYKSLIRESFANNHSVVFVVPTVVDLAYAEEDLGNGITKHVVTLANTHGKKTLTEAYKTLQDMSHPKLIIATPQYGFIERGDVRSVVLERSRANTYRTQSRPHIDYRVAHHMHAKTHKRVLISGDTIISTHDEHLLRQERAEPYEDDRPKRIDLSAKLEVEVMIDRPDGTTPFKLFSDTLLEYLRIVKEKKERAFLFAARRGLAPIVACSDCGHILRDPESGAPVSLHRVIKNGAEERWLYCSVSGYRERAKDLCPVCGSWRLRERGIGIQHIYDELIQHVDPERITLFDHTTASTAKKAFDLHEKFYKTKGGILLGTKIALPYIKKPVFYSVITSMDALRSIPSWQQQEEIFGLLTDLREKTTSTVLVQSRTTENNVLEHVYKGQTARFYDEELALRQQFDYPPFAVFVHFQWQGTTEAVQKVAQDIEKLFSADNISVYVAGAHAPESGKASKQALIRVPSHAWPDTDLVRKIRSLPPSIRVMINPDRIV